MVFRQEEVERMIKELEPLTQKYRDLELALLETRCRVTYLEKKVKTFKGFKV